MSDDKFSASSYRKRKAERIAKIEPEWVTNPETQERFYLRKVSAIAYAIAGAMSHNLTNDAVQSWKENGVEVGESGPPSKPTDEGNRNAVLMARVVQEACVLPKIVQGATKDDELDPSELDDRDVMFIFRWATGQVGLVGMQGGQAMNVADLKSLSKKPGRRTRTGTDG